MDSVEFASSDIADLVGLAPYDQLSARAKVRECPYREAGRDIV